MLFLHRFTINRLIALIIDLISDVLSWSIYREVEVERKKISLNQIFILQVLDFFSYNFFLFSLIYFLIFLFFQYKFSDIQKLT